MADLYIEVEEKEPVNRMREALGRYHETDPTIPLGGMPIREYERLRHEVSLADESMLSPEEMLEAGWLELEYMIAMMRGAINPETEEPYTAKNFGFAKDVFRQRMSRVIKSEFTPPVVRAEARLALLNVMYHEEIIKYGVKLPNMTQSTVYLKNLQHIATELLQEDLDADGHAFADSLGMQMVLAEYSLDTAWFLHAAPRQPWHVTAHSTGNELPDQFLLVAEEGPEEITVITQELLRRGFDTTDDHPLLYAYLEMPAGYSYTKKISVSSAAAVLAYNRNREKIEASQNALFGRLNKQKEWQLAHGILPASERAKQTSVEEEQSREMFAEALWYITDYNSEQTPLETLTKQAEALAVMRRTEGLMPDEQRILGWMQLEIAIITSQLANGDPAQLEAARKYFGVAMETFMRAAKAFDRAHMPGDAIDMLLALEGSAVYRALFISTDPYAVRRTITEYQQKLAELASSTQKVRSKIKADDVQFAAFMEVLVRISACLLQSAATEETARHLVVPAPVRLNSPPLRAYPIDAANKVARYDINNPVGVVLVDGDGVKAKPGQVIVGRAFLADPDKPFALFEEMARVLSSGGKSKGKAKGGGKQSQKAERSPATDELSIRLGDKIFDASEGVDDDTAKE